MDLCGRQNASRPAPRGGRPRRLRTGGLRHRGQRNKTATGRYKLIEYSGAFSGSADSLSISGLDGLAREIAVEDGSVCLIVHEQRQPADGVDWTGAESGTWDYSALNFQLKDGTATAFVALDTLTFGDKAGAHSHLGGRNHACRRHNVANSQTEYTFRGEGRTPKASRRTAFSASTRPDAKRLPGHQREGTGRRGRPSVSR